MKRKIIALLLCIVCVVSLCFPVAADDDGYSAIVSDIDKTCPTCGATLHASWGSTSGAEVELEISDTGKVKIPAGAGAFARIHLRCSSCGYEKTETRLLGLDFGAEKPGKLVQAPSGIGRKDLPGYADDNGTPNYSADGELQIAIYPSLSSTSNNLQGYPTRISESLNANGGSVKYVISGLNGNIDSNLFDLDLLSLTFYYAYTLDPPVSGLYYNRDEQKFVTNIVWSSGSTLDYYYIRKLFVNKHYSAHSKVTLFSGYCTPYVTKTYPSYNFKIHPIILNCIPDASTVNNQTNITINNNTWNGNIYTDNSTNLTYIYPQYTTVNEKNETVTNISNTPIIYNNETKQYYTYDQTTKNYYYITYNAQPTPSPSPTPAPTDKPGGSISTPETGKPGNSSGSSWWDKLLGKIGDAIIDGLLGAVSAVLKLIFKLLSTILSWIIWAVSRVFDLLPFLPPGLGGLLVGGVVVCFVIGIIKFIRG